jgi:hypothetical protein
MSTRALLRATLYWHVRKARHLFQLASTRLTPRPRAPVPTGVRWG